MQEIKDSFDLFDMETDPNVPDEDRRIEAKELKSALKAQNLDKKNGAPMKKAEIAALKAEWAKDGETIRYNDFFDLCA